MSSTLLARVLPVALSLSLVAGCATSGGKGTSAASGPSAAPDDAPLGVRIPLQKRQLANGLRVLVVEDPQTPVVTYQTWVNVGSVDEQPGATGLAHLFEHLMFKGTANYGPKAFFQELEAKGAVVNAATTRDYTYFYVTATPPLLDKIIELESDRLRGLVLNQQLLDVERLVVLEERRMRLENNPGARIGEALWDLAFERHPYRTPVIGAPEDLVATTLPTIRDFYDRYYRPGNVTVLVVGAVSAADVFARIERAYGALPGGAPPARAIPPEPEPREERRRELHDFVAAEQLGIAYRITSVLDPDSYALDVLSNILFEGTASRAHRALVERDEVALVVAGSSYTPTFPGLLTLSVSVKKGRSSRDAERAWDGLVAELVAGGVTEDEVKRAVRQLTLSLLDGIRSPQGLATMLGTFEVGLHEPERFLRDIGRYERITREDVLRVARAYLDPNRRSVVTLKPQAGARPEEGAAHAEE